MSLGKLFNHVLDTERNRDTSVDPFETLNLQDLPALLGDVSFTSTESKYTVENAN